MARSDFTGLTDMYLDTSAYNLDPNFQNIFLRDPKELDQRRLRAYRYFMDFYRSRQWEEVGEFNPAYGNKTLLQEEFSRRTWNISKNIIDKLISFMVKEPWTIKLPAELEDNVGDDDEAITGMTDAANKGKSQIGSQAQPLGSKPKPGLSDSKPQDGDDPDTLNSDGPANGKPPTGPDGAPDFGPSQGKPVQESHPIHDLLEAVWEANDRDAFSYKMAYMGCVTGDCFIRITYDEDFYADGVGELRFKVLDSRTVQPFFDEEDPDTLIGVRIQYPVKELQSDSSISTRMYREVHTDSNIIYLLDDEVTNVVPNPLGELMVVHIKNEPLPWERYGRSDLYDLIIPNKEYNEKVSDLSEILAYHAAPVTIVKGARVNNLEKGARKIWGGIPKDGDVFNLTLDSDLQSTLDYLTLLKTFIHQTGSVPEETLSNVQEISNTSGSALHLQYQPILDRIGRKTPEYSKGLQQINRIILRFYEAVGVIDLPEDCPPALKYKTSIVWGDSLPRDRSIDLSDISTEMGLGIESKRGALKRLGEENPEAKLEEIKQEAMEQAEMDFMTTGLGAFGDPTAGPDGMGGTAAGADDGPQNDVSGAVAAAKTNPVTQGNQTSVQAVKKSAQTTTGAQAKKP